MRQYDINDITRFSDLEEVKLATTGKYAKYDTPTYRIDIVKDICFIHTFSEIEQTIDIPEHMPFSYTDDNGMHTVRSETHITVTGITSFNFITK